MPATPTQELLDYAACAQCALSPVDAMRIALLDQISQGIGGGGGETFYLLSQPGDILISQAGDRLVYQ